MREKHTAMGDFIILGTDTDAGKTTFAMLWLAIFREQYAYWKPVESGASDTAVVSTMVSDAHWFPPALRYEAPLAPPYAAQLQGEKIPDAWRIAQMKPKSGKNGKDLLIETFGSPFSPLTDSDLQVALIQELSAPTLLISSSKLGAIGRTLQCLYALRGESIRPSAIVLVGAADRFAERQILRFGCGTPVHSIESPANWTPTGVARAAQRQGYILEELRSICAGI